ncbi:MAG: allantoate amidohydrolase [Deinococcota bacterium]
MSNLSSASPIATKLARKVMVRCDHLGALSDDGSVRFRPFLSPATARVHEALRGYMNLSELEPRVDALGNLIGHYESKYTGDIMQAPSVETLLLGSHIDTVVNAGKYDGILGVLVSLAVVEAFHERAQALPFDIEVVAFSEEEGVRFGVPFLGSLAVSGQFDESLFELKDDGGVSLEQSLVDFGCHPAELPDADLRDALAFIEVHIEQGPYLASVDAPLGIVTDIAGQSRVNIVLQGSAGHAGTTPMNLRQDALVAASMFICEVERMAKATDGLVATVGQLQVTPGAINVIPGEVQLSLDLRHPDDSVRTWAVRMLEQYATSLCHARGLQLSWQITSEQVATPMSATLTSQLERALYDAPKLISGAGHDAMVMAKTIPTALLFVRSPNGISHHPDEIVDERDVALAIDALLKVIETLATTGLSQRLDTPGEFYG